MVPAAQGIVFHSSRARKEGARRVNDADTCSLSDFFFSPSLPQRINIPSMDGVR